MSHTANHRRFLAKGYLMLSVHMTSGEPTAQAWLAHGTHCLWTTMSPQLLASLPRSQYLMHAVGIE